TAVNSQDYNSPKGLYDIANCRYINQEKKEEDGTKGTRMAMNIRSGTRSDLKTGNTLKTETGSDDEIRNPEEEVTQQTPGIPSSER
ncbi:Hypothetical predicted protein, partial [Pelobates cultripes]